MPCTPVKASFLSVLHGMAVEGDRSSDVSLKPDPVEQIFAYLNLFENRLCDIQAVIPLLKGPLSKVKGSSHHHLQKQLRGTLSHPTEASRSGCG